MSPIPAGILASSVARATYLSEVMADAPALYWRLGDASKATGATAADSSGNGRNGTYNNTNLSDTTGLVAGDADHAALFGGSTGNRAELAGSAFANTNVYTIEAIVRNNFSPGSQRVIASTEGTNVGARGWQFRLDATSKLQLADVDNSTTTAPSALTINTAYHVAYVSDGTDRRLYQNGVLVATNATPGLTPFGSTGRVFGAGSTHGAAAGYFIPWSGTLDEIAYYTSALPVNRILAHAHAAGY